MPMSDFHRLYRLGQSIDMRVYQERLDEEMLSMGWEKKTTPTTYYTNEDMAVFLYPEHGCLWKDVDRRFPGHLEKLIYLAQMENTYRVRYAMTGAFIGTSVGAVFDFSFGEASTVIYAPFIGSAVFVSFFEIIKKLIERRYSPTTDMEEIFSTLEASS